MFIAGIILAVIILLGFTRFGILAARDEDGQARLILKAGFLRIDLLKRMAKAKEKSIKKPKAPKEETKFSAAELIRIIKSILSPLVKGLRIDELSLNFNVAGSRDPYDAAMLFGGIQVAWGVLRPVLVNSFQVRKENVRFNLDFDLEETKWHGTAKITISLGRSLAVLLAGVRANMQRSGKTNGKQEKHFRNHGRDNVRA